MQSDPTPPTPPSAPNLSIQDGNQAVGANPLIVLPPETVGKSEAETARHKLQLLTRKQRSKYSQQYVVMDRYRTTVLQVPGTGLPFCNTSKRHVDAVAAEVGGVCETLLDAIELVASSPCNFPKDSKHYDQRKSAAKLKWMFGKGHGKGFGV